MKREKLNQERAEIRRRVYEEIQEVTEDEPGLCDLTGYTLEQIRAAIGWLKRNRLAYTVTDSWLAPYDATDPCWIHGIERINGICQLCERQKRLELNSEK